MSTFFKPPFSKLLQRVLCLIFGFAECHKNCFWIVYNSSSMARGTAIIKEMYTIFEIAKVLKISIFPSSDKERVFHRPIICRIFLTILTKFFSF